MYINTILAYLVLISKVSAIDLHGYNHFRNVKGSKRVLHKLKFETKISFNAMPLWEKLGTCLKEDLADEEEKASDELIYEEKNMSTPQLIQFHGYQSEGYSVETKDGYVLGIFKATNENPKKKSVVLLHHGIMGSSDDWLLLGPGKALPYLLIDAGYDVWLANARGNRYSRHHIQFRAKDFWDFSFNEMGQYDLPATIKFIRNKSRKGADIHFVGHSMGGTALLVLLSTVPDYNKVLKTATLLAPLAYMSNIKGPLRILAGLYKKHGKTALSFLGDSEFMSPETNLRKYLDKHAGRSNACLNPLLFMANGGKGSLDAAVLENVLGHVPTGTSIKTIEHYIQLVLSKQFQQYDYGEAENVKKHGKITVPSYNLSVITVPLFLFSSNSDWLCTRPNMMTLRLDLFDVVDDYTINRNVYKHTDFVWGEDATALVFLRIIDVLEVDMGRLRFLPAKQRGE